MAKQVSWTKIILWGLFLPLAGFLAMRMVMVGLSSYNLEQGGEASVGRALFWMEDNPRARFPAALEIVESDPERAETMLRQVIYEWPVDGRMLAALGVMMEQRGDIVAATRAMDYAHRLAPAKSAVQLELAAFWARRQDLERYMTHLLAVMSLNRRYWQRLSPVLLAQIESPGAFPVMRKLLSEALEQRDQGWWPDFFAYVADNAKTVDSVRLLYHIRSQSEHPPGSSERRLFEARLEKDGLWLDAYFVWLNSLDKEGMKLLGNIYNGGFEAPLSNYGFGWRVGGGRYLGVGVARTDGSVGFSALRLNYRKLLTDQLQIGQYLMLPPGKYEFDGRVRVDNLLGKHGIRWLLQCVDTQKTLWNSQSFAGVKQWHGFGGRFEVPGQACQAQYLSLVATQASEEDRGISGTLWFDGLAVKSLE
jgi:hypothetical protein